MPDYTLPRAERLRSLKAIRRMFDEGHSGFVYPFRYVSLVERADAKRADAEREDVKRADAEKANAESSDVEMTAAVETIDAESRRVEVMFSVPKKYHKRANKRNLLRRRTKESYRLQKELLTLHVGNRNLDLALVYSAREVLPSKKISHALRRILESIAQQL